MEKNYAILPDRVKAAVIDGIILIALMYATSEIFSFFNEVPQYVRISVFILIAILYDPIFTSKYGGTIGHTFSGISVKKENESTKNISFPVAIVRFILKALLGWISLLTVTMNEQRKAIHDFVAGSIVIEDKKS